MATRKYEQRLRAVSAEQTRRDVLTALEHRLTETRGAAIGLEDVARRAGVSRSTVYLVFGSRAGLFDALARDLWERSGLARLTEAVAHPDAREHLRGGLRAGTEIFAAMRDVAAVLFAMSALDPDAVGGAIVRMEDHRWGGMLHLARRLAEQGELRDDVTEAEAADTLWVLAGFESFDALYTGRGLSTDEVARRLVATAERSLCT
ncbi:TetR/AcrR family transcriptional regulator [Actinomycetospora rhizophila]|uniref:TetR/AcrR family transcriptional regulator n=1 Tax=Actinomycetospora rhizophila TaxID=1416876 RepID=A0ABV9Z9Z0_9PSEU